MPEPVKNTQIRCLHCHAWFGSPIAFETFESFATSTLFGNTVSCPHCGKDTGCNKENMRIQTVSGNVEYVGSDTQWEKDVAQAVTSSTDTETTATATGFPDIASASKAVNYVVSNIFAPAPSPEQVPDEKFEDLQAKIVLLEEKIKEAAPAARTHAFQCKADFDDTWKLAATKMEKFRCLVTYLVCLTHGFDITVKV